MNRVRFMLAVPRKMADQTSLVRVASPDQVRAQQSCFWASHQTPICELSKSVLVLGALFPRQPGASPVLPEAPAIQPVETAQFVLAEYWGAYLALIRAAESKSLSLFVDPSGFVPVYHAVTAGHHLFTTDPDFLEAEPSYPDIFNHLMRPELRHRETCLTGIAEVPPGSLVDLSMDCVEYHQLWKPEHFFESRRISAFSDASDLLRQQAVNTIGTWARFFGKVGVAASGGVDSSLVCAALASSSTAFDCISLATADASGNERRHALSVANHLGVKYLDRVFDPELFDPSRSASTGLARPSRRAFLSLYDDALESARIACEANVVMDGNVGDNLFCYLHSAAPVADRLRTAGLGYETFRTLVDMCRITHCSMPAMIGATIGRLTGRGPSEAWPPDLRLLNDEYLSGDFHPLTPWLDDWTPDRSGHLDHLRLLMHAQNHVNGLTSARSRFSPLASQPLVELCLGIPTWLWAEGGLNRAVARAAFASDLPQAVVRRTSKSGPDSLIRFAFASKRTEIAGRLLDGLLAQNDLLDTGALESALKVDEFRDLTLVERILDILEAANWARFWTD